LKRSLLIGKGKIALRSERIEIPEPPKELRLHKKKKILFNSRLKKAKEIYDDWRIEENL
jgi:hypothetical protein